MGMPLCVCVCLLLVCCSSSVCLFVISLKKLELIMFVMPGPVTGLEHLKTLVVWPNTQENTPVSQQNNVNSKFCGYNPTIYHLLKYFVNVIISVDWHKLQAMKLQFKLMLHNQKFKNTKHTQYLCMYKKYMQILFQYFNGIEHFPFIVMFSLLSDQWTLCIL